MNAVLTRRNIVEVTDEAGIVNIALGLLDGTQTVLRIGSYAEAVAATIASSVTRLVVTNDGIDLTYARAPGAPWLTTADGATWAPAEAPTLLHAGMSSTGTASANGAGLARAFAAGVTCDGLGRSYAVSGRFTPGPGAGIVNADLDFSTTPATEDNAGDWTIEVVCGALGDPISATANIAAGATVIQLDSTAGLAAGDRVRVGQNAGNDPLLPFRWSTAPAIPLCETGFIASVDSATQITLTRPLQWGYTTADGAYARKITTGLPGRWHNVTLRGGLTQYNALNFAFCEGFHLGDFRFEGFRSRNLYFETCFNGTWGDVYAVGSALDALNYATAVINGCENLHGGMQDGEDLRHTFTGGGRRGINRKVSIRGCHGLRSRAAVYDNHSPCEGFSVLNPRATAPNFQSGTPGDEDGAGNEDAITLQGVNCTVLGLDVDAGVTGRHGVRIQQLCDAPGEWQTTVQGVIRNAGRIGLYASTEGLAPMASLNLDLAVHGAGTREIAGIPAEDQWTADGIYIYAITADIERINGRLTIDGIYSGVVNTDWRRSAIRIRQTDDFSVLNTALQVVSRRNDEYENIRLQGTSANPIGNVHLSGVCSGGTVGLAVVNADTATVDFEGLVISGFATAPTSGIHRKRPWTPEDFGADPSLADSGPAILAALAHAAGRPVVGYGNTYNINSSIVFDVDFDLSDMELVGTFNGRILSAVAPVRDLVALTADYVPGSLDVAVATLSSAPPAGTWVKLLSDAVEPNSRDLGPRTSGQSRAMVCIWVQLDEGSTTTNLRLLKPLPVVTGIDPAAAGTGTRVEAFTTAMGARAAIPQPRTARLRNVKWRQITGQEATWSGHLVSINGYQDVVTEDTATTYGYGQSLSLGGCRNSQIIRHHAENLWSNPAQDQFGYGVHDTGGHGNQVIGLTGSRCRHVYTTGQAPQTPGFTDPERLWRAGRTTNFAVIDADVAGGDEDGDTILAPLDTHHGARNGVFRGCSVRDAGVGLASRGQDVRVEGLTVRNCGQAVHAFTERQDGDTYPLSTGKLPEDFSSLSVTGLDADVFDLAIRSTTAHLTLSGRNRIRSSCRAVVGGTGQTVIAGDLDITVDTRDGASDGVTNDAEWNASGIFAPVSNLEPDRTIQGTPLIRVLPGASVRIANTVAGPGGAANRLLQSVTTAGAPDVTGALRVDGDVQISLPDDGVLWGANEPVTCYGAGLIRYSRGAGATDGAADHVSSKRVRVQSDDGVVYWSRPADMLRRDYEVQSSAPGTVHSATSTNDNILTPQVAEMLPLLAAGDVMRFRMTGRKTGTAGGVTLRARVPVAGTVSSLVLASGASTWSLDFEVTVISTTSQVYRITWQGDATQTLEVVAGTLDLATAAYLLRIGATAMTSPDTIIIDTVTVTCTAGGGQI